MPRKKQGNRGSSKKSPQIVEKVLEFVMERRQCGQSVCTSEISVHGTKVSMSMKIKDFKASADLCYAFMTWKDLSIRRRTHISQKLPEDYEDKLVEFQKSIIKQRKLHDYDLSQISNANQTPINIRPTCSNNRRTQGLQDSFNQHYRPRPFCQYSVLFYSIKLHMQIMQGNKLTQDYWKSENHVLSVCKHLDYFHFKSHF